ncbi:hypothetical protein H7200_02460 [Candidatus Saccharibacteria bacterium]|nr:hypothetical protein [Candidatus Saccharibacteria bacterium]
MEPTYYNRILIVGSDAEAAGAVLLADAAKNHGLIPLFRLTTDPDVVDRINDSQFVVYRINPTTYKNFVKILSRVNQLKADKLRGVLDAFDKNTTATILIGGGIATPMSWSIGHDDVIEDFPVVIKIANSNQGKGVALLHSTEDFAAYSREFPDEKIFLVQEYIKESGASDKRIFVSGDRVVGAMRRTSTSDDFRANLHLGGTADAYDPTEQEKAMAIKASQLFRLDFSGVDIIDSHRGPLVLEVNSSPGFAIGEVIGIDVAAEVIKDLIK